MTIPTGNSRADIKAREQIISGVYRQWLEKHPSKRAYNHSLKAYINVRYLSVNETMEKAAKTYLSTLAVLQLDTILSQARKYGPLRPPKPNSNQKPFAKMIIMRLPLEGIGTVKMTVGLKKNGEHVQYCITAIQA